MIPKLDQARELIRSAERRLNEAEEELSLADNLATEELKAERRLAHCDLGEAYNNLYMVEQEIFKEMTAEYTVS